MAFDNTITESDLDQDARTLIAGLGTSESEPDLAVDGLSDSLLARILRLFRLA